MPAAVLDEAGALELVEAGLVEDEAGLVEVDAGLVELGVFDAVEPPEELLPYRGGPGIG